MTRDRGVSQRLLATCRLLSEEECDELLLELEETPGWRVAGGTAGNTRVIDVPSRVLAKHGLPSRIEKAIAARWPWTIGGVVFTEAALVRYCVGAVVPSHTDTNPEKRDRVFSLIVYLTDGFEGGHLCIPSLDYRAVSPRGFMAVFPSTELHWADPVVAGDKSVLVGFLSSVIL